jgi:hypothetical protein
MPNQCYEAHHKICKLRYGTPGYGKNHGIDQWGNLKGVNF